MTCLPRSRVAAIVLILFATGCAHGPFSPLELKALPGADAFPNASAVIVLAETTVEFHPGDGGRAVADVTTHEQWRVLQPGGAQPGSVKAHYVRGFSEVLSIDARIVRPDGEVEAIDPKKAIDAPEFDQSLYDDERSVRLPVPTLPAGAVLEYRYVVRDLEPRLFQESYGFGASVPTRRERFVVILPAEWSIDHLERRLDQPITLPPSATSVDGGRQRFEWALDDLPAASDPDPSAPVPPVVAVRLKTWTEGGAQQQGFANARELSAWVDTLVKGVDEETPELRKTTEALLVGLGPDPERRARRIHRFVCDEIEYCAIELGYGAWKPHDAAKVAQLRYGDCKDKANLLRTMLEIAGVQSRLVLVSAHDGLPFPFGLPTVAGNFNHMVLMVDLPDRSVLVDPTQRAVPFGEIPPSIAEADVLPIQPGGAELQRAPALSPDANGEQLEVSLSPDGSGALVGDFTLSQHGAPASELRARLLRDAAASRDKGMREWLGFSDADVEGASFQGLERGASFFAAKGRLKIRAALRGSSDTKIVTAADLLTARVPVATAPARRTPWVFLYRRADEDTASVRLPSGAQLRSMPSPVNLESPFGTYALSWTQEDGALVLHRSLRLTEHIVRPSDYAQLREFLGAIHTAEAKPALLDLAAISTNSPP